jgi:hypothetical protein
MPKMHKLANLDISRTKQVQNTLNTSVVSSNHQLSKESSRSIRFHRNQKAEAQMCMMQK